MSPSITWHGMKLDEPAWLTVVVESETASTPLQLQNCTLCRHAMWRLHVPQELITGTAVADARLPDSSDMPPTLCIQ